MTSENGRKYLTGTEEIRDLLDRVLGGDTRHLEPALAELSVGDFALYMDMVE